MHFSMSRDNERQQRAADLLRYVDGASRRAIDPHVHEVPARRRFIFARTEKSDVVAHRRPSEARNAQPRIDHVGKREGLVEAARGLHDEAYRRTFAMSSP